MYQQKHRARIWRVCLQFLPLGRSASFGLLTTLALLANGCFAKAMPGEDATQFVFPDEQKAVSPLISHPISQELASEHRTLALAGLRVRAGDVIDAITPIFVEITDDRGMGDTWEGTLIGGMGGGETLLMQEGYLVTGLNVTYGDYFGASELVHLEVIWSKFTPKGLNPNDTITSERLGSGNFATLFQLEELRSELGHYISDIYSTTSTHTSGETFLNSIAIESNPLFQ